MVDITKCDNEKCTVKGSCYRYTAKSGAYQSWATFHQGYNEIPCDNFITIKSPDVQNSEVKK